MPRQQESITLTCSSCKATGPTITPASDVYDADKREGWSRLYTTATGTHFRCPDCRRQPTRLIRTGGVRIDRDELEQIDQLAEAEAVTRSDIIRKAIAHYLTSVTPRDPGEHA